MIGRTFEQKKLTIIIAILTATIFGGGSYLSHLSHVHVEHVSKTISVEQETPLTPVAQAPTPLQAQSIAHVEPEQPKLSSTPEKSKSTIKAAPLTGSRELVYTVRAGDNLRTIFTKFGVSTQDVHNLVKTMKSVFDPRAFKIGQDLTIRLQGDGKHPVTVEFLSFKTGRGNTIILEKTEGNFSFKAQKKELQLTKHLEYVDGFIQTTFHAAASKSGVPSTIVRTAANLIDYHTRQKHSKSDRFTLAYEVFKDETGQVIKSGDVKFVSCDIKGEKRCIYQFQASGGAAPAYYNEKGESVVKAAFTLPLGAFKARINSRFGLRPHPISGYTRHHKGVDYRAPQGTPVVSSGDGVVVRANWYGNYGNYILVRHNNEYSTAYAHLSKISVKAGDRVRQGQVIGAVGATGNTTGAHLHYEVIHRGQQINPQTVKYMSTEKLSKKDMIQFVRMKTMFDVGRFTSKKA